MVLKNKNTWLVGLTSFWIILVMVIGVWWLYLILSLSDQLELLYQLRPELNKGTNFAKLVFWEGITFTTLLLTISATLSILWYRDKKKNRSLQAFLAGVTHELKTPLASIRLQTEVLYESVEHNEQTKKLMNRLVEDTVKLETQLDKVLQLSRIEKGGVLNKRSIPLRSFVLATIAPLSKQCLIDIPKDLSVEADEYALSIILRNLVENSHQHATRDEVALEMSIKAKQVDDKVVITFHDNGKSFDGPVEKLGKLFFKYKSSKGSGIGLYLSRRLVEAMGGLFRITAEPNLTFEIILARGRL